MDPKRKYRKKRNKSENHGYSMLKKKHYKTDVDFWHGYKQRLIAKCEKLNRPTENITINGVQLHDSDFAVKVAFSMERNNFEVVAKMNK